MVAISPKRAVKISRPRFWIYIFGPLLLGMAAAIQGPDLAVGLFSHWPFMLLLAYQFSFPANLLLYGVNDIFDYETDKLNPKKQTYEALVKPEERRSLIRWIIAVHAPIALFWITLTLTNFSDLAPERMVTYFSLSALFFFLSIGYSMPPIRAKARPFLDSAFNVLYIVPGIIGYLFIAPVPTISPSLVWAAAFWCMAMHAYSAVPDIAADKKAQLQTIATKLGASTTLWFCTACYAAAALLATPSLHWLAYALGVTYVSLMGLSMYVKNETELFRYYTIFPWINSLAGASLFLFILVAR